METKEIVTEVSFNELVDRVRLMKKEHKHETFSTCFDKALKGFQIQWAYWIRKYKKDRAVLGLTLADKVAIERAEKAKDANLRFIRLSRFEVEDLLKHEKGTFH